MQGIVSMDPFGMAHALLGLAALVLGLVVFARPKGAALHRLWGTGYVVAMVLLNASGLSMYGYNGRFNMFHVFALLSLATIAGGWVPVLTRRPARVWYARHAMFMAWSYVGLVAAFVSEVAVRLPFVRPGAMFGTIVGVASVGVVAAGGLVIRRRMPPAVARMARTA